MRLPIPAPVRRLGLADQGVPGVVGRPRVVPRRAQVDVAARRGPRLPARRDIADWLGARGLLPVAETAFMVRGPWPPPGDHDQLFCPLTVALG